MTEVRDASQVAGTTPYRNAALLATATAVKASAGRLYGWHVKNLDTTDTYLQFYDVASGGVTVGTTTPAFTLWIPGNGGLDTDWTPPINFLTAITIAATTTIGGGTAPATGLLVDLFYV